MANQDLLEELRRRQKEQERQQTAALNEANSQQEYFAQLQQLNRYDLRNELHEAQKKGSTDRKWLAERNSQPVFYGGAVGQDPHAPSQEYRDSVRQREEEQQRLKQMQSVYGLDNNVPTYVQSYMNALSNGTAQEAIDQGKDPSRIGMFGLYSYLTSGAKNLSDDEKNTYRYIYTTYGTDAANKYLDTLKTGKKVYGNSFDILNPQASVEKEEEVPELKSLDDVTAALNDKKTVAGKRAVVNAYFDTMPDDVKDLLNQYDEGYLQYSSGGNNAIKEDGHLLSFDRTGVGSQRRNQVQGNQKMQEAGEALKEKLGINDSELATLLDYRQYKANYDENQRRNEEINDLLHTGNAAKDAYHAATMTAKTIAMSPMNGMASILGNASNKTLKRSPFTGIASYLFDSTERRPELGTDTYSPFYGMTNYSQNVRGNTQNRIAENEGALGKYGSKAYGIGTSIGDSMVNATVGGALGLPNMGMAGKLIDLAPIGANAYATTLQQGLERGLSEKQAQGSAAVAGLAEMATEVFSLDHFWDMTKGSSRLARNYVVDWLAQAGIEGSEEVASDVINLIADNLINADQSEYWSQVREYAKNMSLDEAKAQATRDKLMEIGESFVGGAISGGVMGGVGVATNVSNTNRAAKTSFEKGGLIESAQALSENREDYKNTSAYESAKKAKAQAEQIAKKQEAGTQISDKELRQLYWNVNDALDTEAQTRNDARSIKVKERNAVDDNADIQSVIDYYSGQGNTIDVDQIVPAMARAESAEELVSLRKAAENAADSSARSAALSAYQLNKGRVMSEYNQTAEDFENAEKMPSASEAFNAGMEGGKLSETASDEAKQAYIAGQQVALVKTSRSSINEDIAGSSVSLSDGKTAELTGEVRGTGENLQAKTKDGLINISDIQDNAVRYLYEEASKQNGQAAAQTFINNYAKGMPVGRYANTFDRYYAAGATGTTSFEDLIKKDDLAKKWMSEDQLRNIYEYGQRETAGQMQSDAVRQHKAIAVRGEGKVIDARANRESEVEYLPLVEAMAKATGMNYVLSDSTADNINGSFNRAMQTVVINTNNAGNELQTLFHEGFGEVLQAHNAEGHQRVQNAIMSYIAENFGQDAITRIGKKYQDAYIGVEGTKGFNEAMGEAINDSIAGIFTSEDGIQDFTDWVQEKYGQKESKTILQNIADFFKDLADSFKQLLRRSDLSETSRMTANMAADRAGEIRKIVLKEMNIALENARNAETNENAETGEAYSIKDIPDSIDTIIEENRRGLASMDVMETVTSDLFPKSEISLIDQVAEYFESIGGNVYNDIIGDVALTKRGIKDSVSHKGFNRMRAIAFAAVPNVIKNGAIIDYQKNWKNRGYDTITIAAPVDIRDIDNNTIKHSMVATVLMRAAKNNNQRFYLHEVITAEKNESPFKTGRPNGSNPGGDSSLANIIQQAVNNYNPMNQTVVKEVSAKLDALKVPSDVRDQTQQAITDIITSETTSNNSGVVEIGRKNKIISEMLDKGNTSLVGKSVKNVDDLAALAQIYRDPRFETMRYFFTDKNGKIILQTAVSSKIPGASSIIPEGKNSTEYLDSLATKAKEMGATGYYLEHNHPSGDITPSGADWAVTNFVNGRWAWRGLEEKGHLILDHTQYAVLNSSDIKINPDNTFTAEHDTRNVPSYAVREMTEPGKKDPAGLVGTRVMSGDDLASYIRYIQDDHSVLVFANTKLVTGLIQSVPNTMIQDQKGFTDYVHDIAVNNGMSTAFVVSGDKGTYENTLDLIKDGILTDSLYTTYRWSARSEVEPAENADQTSFLGRHHVSEEDVRFSVKLGKDTEIERDNEGNFQLASSKDSNTVVINTADTRHSLKTLSNTQQKLAAVLKEKGHTQEEIDYALDMIQRQADLLSDVSNGYMEMGEALQADIITDIKGGRQVIRSLVKNGEYPVNVDFMTICKKRQAYMKVLTDLIDDGTFAAVSYSPEAIVDVNNILRMNEYETACLGCFVESRRLQIQKWSESFVDAWNRQVQKALNGKAAKSFDFGKNERGRTSLTDEEIEQLHKEFEAGGKKNAKGNLNLGQGTVEEKMARLLERMPTMARTLEVGDILKPNGVDNLRNHYGDLYSLLLQWYGSNTPKVNQDFNPYNGEFADLNYGFMKLNTGENLPKGQKYRTWAKNQILSEHESGYKPSKTEIEQRAIRKYLYDIGGARLQSFSDFLVENSLDYFQMIGDLAAKEYPMHAYSKEISFARMFGMTGIKENMSLIPEVNRAAGRNMAGLNPDGSYVGWGDYDRHIMMKGQSFIQSIGWKDAIALQLDPRYSKNIGTIAIGISDAHIRKMLDDPLIRMVIPYHSSGMNPQFAKAMNIDLYTDYTDFQNTTVKQLYDLNGNPVDSFNGKTKIDLEYDYNEAAQRLGDARKAADEYLAWCAEEHPVYIGSKKVGTATFTPKFERFSASRNYYKLLEDFNMYDAITEEAAPQQAVQMLYPDAEHMLSEQELKDYEARLRETGEFTEKDIQKYLKKAQMTLEDIIRAEAKSRNEYHRAADAKYGDTYKQIKDKLQDYSRNNAEEDDTTRVFDEGSDIRHSVKVTDPETIDFLENQDHITTYRSFQLIDGGLYAPMAAMDYEVDEKGKKIGKKLGYRSEIGQWEQATEAIDVAKTNFANGKKAKDKKTGAEYAKFDLEGGDNQTGGVAYNPYLHSSNVVLNDQFSAAYRRNLVVVECIVPKSELTSGYHAELAKDPVGWREWKAGKVAGKIAKQKEGFERQVFLSRWMKPVRILSDTEVASMYKEYLDGTKGIKVPWNVVTPSLRQALVKQGVEIDYSDASFGTAKGKFADAFPDARYSVKVDTEGRNLTEEQAEYFKNTKLVDDSGALKVMYHGTENEFNVFDFSQGGKNGTAEGYGIYLTDKRDVSEHYGSRIIESYVNMERPAYADRRTITKKELTSLVKESIRRQAQEMIDDYDGDLNAAMLDTWISNYTYTYDKSIDASIKDVVDQILRINDNDMDIIQEVMVGSGVRDYISAPKFYDMLTKLTGIDGLVNKWGREDGGESMIALAFRSNQIKNVTNQAPTEDSDIRHSVTVPQYDDTFWETFENFQSDYDRMTLKDAAAIMEQGAKHLKDLKIDETVIKKLAKSILTRYGSKYSQAELADNLQKVFAYMQENEDANYDEIMDVIKEIALPVIEESEQKVGQEDYDNFLAAFKGRKIALTDTQKQEVISAFGSYQNFRIAMKGINIVSTGTPLDMSWSEIVEAAPGLLEYDTTEGDMPLALYDAMKAMTPTVRNIEGANEREATDELAMEIAQEFFSEMGKVAKNDELRHAAGRLKRLNANYLQTIKERYSESLRQAKEELKKQYAEMGKQIEAERDIKIADFRAKNRKEAVSRREAAAATHERNMIRQQAGRLLEWATNPTNTHHIPVAMEQPVMDFLQAIDFVSPRIRVRTIGGDGGSEAVEYYARVYDSEAKEFVNITGETQQEVQDRIDQVIGTGKGSKSQRRWTDKMTLLHDLYEKVLKGDQFEHHTMDMLVGKLDESLADQLKDVIQRNNGIARVSQMSSADLKVVRSVIENITHAINTQNKAMTIPGMEISEMAEKTMASVNEKTRRQERTRTGNKLVDFLSMDMATPKTFFSMINSDGAYKILRAGRNKRFQNLKKAQAYMEKLTADFGLDEKTVKSWNDIKEYTVNGKRFQMTDRQLMSLYELNKRQQAMIHMPGGITITMLETPAPGIRGKLGMKIQHNQNEAIHLHDADIKKLVAGLSRQQKEVADRMQQYMASECAAWGNEATRAMYGYEKFTETNYFPIMTDKNSISLKNNEINRLTNAIANMGFTKAVTPNARNGIVIADIFDVFTNHVNDMATYNAFAPALADVLQWYNYRVRDTDPAEDFDYSSSVQAAVQAMTGTKGKDYFKKLIADLNQNEQSSNITGIWEGFVSRYKVSSIGGNLRVVMQQPTAIVRASNLINPKYIAQGMSAVTNVKAASEHAKENSDIAWWKSQGYFETNVGKSLKQIITGESTVMEKLQEKSLTLAGLADDVTWGVIYRAVELEQADQFQKAGMDIDGDEAYAYRKAVNERFDDIIDETQVVDTTLNRSQMMRSNDGKVKALTAFMAEPTKSYNMLMNAYIQAYKSSGMTGGRRVVSAAASKAFRRAAATYTATAVVNAAVQSFIDAVRRARKEDDKDYWERWGDAMVENVADNINPLNLIPFVKDVSDITLKGIESMISGENLYGLSSGNNLELEGIISFVTAVRNTQKYLNGEGKMTGYGVFYSDVQAFSRLLGIPVSNLMREATALYDSVRHKYDELPDLFATSTDQVTKAAKNRVWKTIEEGGDYKAALQDAFRKGINSEKFASSVTSQYKPIYLELLQTDPAEAAKLKNRLIAVYSYLAELNGKIYNAKTGIEKWSEED